MLMQCPSELNFLLRVFFSIEKKILGLAVPDLNVCSRIIERGIRSDE